MQARVVTGPLKKEETQDPNGSEEEINDGVQLSTSPSVFVHHSLSTMPGGSLLTPASPVWALGSEQLTIGK